MDDASKHPPRPPIPQDPENPRPGGILPQEGAGATSASGASPVCVDATGTFCPVPILRLARACRPLAPGALVELRATDPGVEADVPAWCEATGSELVSLERQGAVLVARVRKGLQ